ncbi:hypothetical protein AB0J72_05395 [Dactylosporangium sp. NPDC049742]|uniref:hypothetical protein n=1 Tax=Dactylosporangium sp. NPDC049742 TaxID=3154737 RepID=UPI003416A25A
MRMNLRRLAVAVSVLAVVVVGSGTAHADPGPANPGKRVATGRVVTPAGAPGCGTAGAVCIPDGNASVQYNVTGSGACEFTATVNWADPWGGAGSYTYTSATTFRHHYYLPGLYHVSVTGSGRPLDDETTCTFVASTVVFELPEHNYLTDLTTSALQLYSKLSTDFSAKVTARFASLLSMLQKGIGLFQFGRDISEFRNYNDYAKAKLDAYYVQNRATVDVMANVMYGCATYAQCSEPDKVSLAKHMANDTGASGFLIQQSRKAAQSGTSIIFQLP